MRDGEGVFLPPVTGEHCYVDMCDVTALGDM